MATTIKKLRQDMEDNSTYKESEDVRLAKDAMNAHEQTKVADWSGGTYGDALKQQIDKINNREKFSYDLNGDALYQQYKDQYINQGKLAMNDTIGTASAMTGGYGNSYAATAGNQAYQSYLQKINDVTPELYQIAYDKYNQEGENLKDQYSILNNQYATEYDEYRNKVSDWNTEANRLSDKYYNEASNDYSKFSDNRDYYQSLYNNERDYQLQNISSSSSSSSGTGTTAAYAWKSLGYDNYSAMATHLNEIASKGNEALYDYLAASGLSEDEVTALYLAFAKDEEKEKVVGNDIIDLNGVVTDIKNRIPGSLERYTK